MSNGRKVRDDDWSDGMEVGSSSLSVEVVGTGSRQSGLQ